MSRDALLAPAGSLVVLLLALAAVLYGLAGASCFPKTRLKLHLAIFMGAALEITRAAMPSEAPATLYRLDLILAGCWLFLGLFGIWLVLRKSPQACLWGCRLGWPLVVVLWAVFLVRLPPASHRAVARHQTVPGGPRIWVLLFDELDATDLDQILAVNDGRLPTFRALRARSLETVDLSGASGSTLEAIPSLLAGQLLTRGNEVDGPHLRTMTLSGDTQELDPADSLFSDIHTRGGSTAVLGWYWPYPRVYRNYLDGWSWVPDTLFGFESDRALPFGKQVAMHLGALNGPPVPRELPWDRDPKEASTRAFEGEVVEFRAQLRRFLEEGPAGLTWIHCPLPHGPGLGSKGNYQSNIDRADLLLRDILARQAQLPGADQDCIVILSDHPLRSLWEGVGAFLSPRDLHTAPEMNRRIVFWVSLPGQTEPRVAAQHLKTPVVRPTLLAIAEGKVRSPAELDRWLTGHATPVRRH